MTGRAIYKLHQKLYTDNIMSNITIEELARMSQSEFTSIRNEMKEGFDTVGRRFDRMDEQFDSLTQVVLGIKDMIESDTTQLKERVTRVEETIGIGK